MIVTNTKSADVADACLGKTILKNLRMFTTTTTRLPTEIINVYKNRFICLNLLTMLTIIFLLKKTDRGAQLKVKAHTFYLKYVALNF